MGKLLQLFLILVLLHAARLQVENDNAEQLTNSQPTSGSELGILSQELTQLKRLTITFLQQLVVNDLQSIKTDLAAIRETLQGQASEQTKIKHRVKSVQSETEQLTKQLDSLISDLEQRLDSLTHHTTARLQHNNGYWKAIQTQRKYFQQALQNTTRQLVSLVERGSTSSNIREVLDTLEELKNESCSRIFPGEPASSCEEIASNFPLSPPGYYWIQEDNSSLSQQFCSMTSQDSPAPSCQEIIARYPSTTSGYYWVKNSTGHGVQVFCEMNETQCNGARGWTRVAHTNFTKEGRCPRGLQYQYQGCKVYLQYPYRGCGSINIATHGVNYTRVCGRITCFQSQNPDAFSAYKPSLTIDDVYVDGVSITHGRSPRKHVWTFAMTSRDDWGACPCTNPGAAVIAGVLPSFVGSDYYCYMGQWHPYNSFNTDPLWDGVGCNSTNFCCTFSSAAPPWFSKQLPQPTTDDIEVRVCHDNELGYVGEEDVYIGNIELYVQ